MSALFKGESEEEEEDNNSTDDTCGFDDDSEDWNGTHNGGEAESFDVDEEGDDDGDYGPVWRWLWWRCSRARDLKEGHWPLISVLFPLQAKS